jgi:hypothetical protein
VPRDDQKESATREGRDGLSPRAPFFVAPNEVGGASLTPGKTKKGARQDEVEGAF